VSRLTLKPLALATLLAAGCGGGDPGLHRGGLADSEAFSTGAVQTVLVRHTGRVVVSAGEGLTTTAVSADDGSTVPIAGDLLPEIQRLAGARLMVEGIPAGGSGLMVYARRYQVLEVNGERPVVGVLVRVAEGHALVFESTVLVLTDVSERLAEMVGFKVWVTGPIAGDRLRVRSFGVIRAK
jgi:hypothetical protein